MLGGDTIAPDGTILIDLFSRYSFLSSSLLLLFLAVFYDRCIHCGYGKGGGDLMLLFVVTA